MKLFILISAILSLPSYGPELPLGKHPVVIIPVNFSNENWHPDPWDKMQSRVERYARDLARRYDSYSRGQVELVGQSGNGPITVYPPQSVSVSKSCGNRSPAKTEINARLNLPKLTAKVWLFPYRTCSYANASGGDINTSGKLNGMTVTHEMGHIFRLGHGSSFKWGKDGTIIGLDNYGDRSTTMGHWSSSTYNAPQLHQMGWLKDEEVVQVEDGGIYQLRRLDYYGRSVSGYLSALAHKTPHGNWLYISYRRQSKWTGVYFDDDKGFAANIDADCERRCPMHATALVGYFGPHFEDETGLVVDTLEQDYRSAKVKVTLKEPTCGQPIDITTAHHRVRKASQRTRGLDDITITVTNPNQPPCRPVMVAQKIRLVLPKGSSYRRMDRFPGWFYAGESKSFKTRVRIPKPKEGEEPKIQIIVGNLSIVETVAVIQ